MTTLEILRAGPAVSVQDGGRPGALGLGLSPGGAADRRGWLSVLALAGAPRGTAAVEMAGLGGRFRFSERTCFALAGAPMRATLDGAPLEWNATHRAEAGATLEIGGAEAGVYGYLLPAGGIATEPELGGRGYHRIGGLGRALAAGDTLPLGADPEPEAPPLRLPPDAPAEGPIRVMPGPQTELFDEATRAAFEAAIFRRSAKANRQGVRLDHDGAPFATGGQLSQVSDFIAVGDIQMAGDGMPYVLLADCQSMGGYPRIGTVLPGDLGRVAQAQAGETMTFRFVSVGEAERAWQSDEAILAEIAGRLVRRLRDPREIRDLLSYDLIGKPRDEVAE